MRSFPRIFSSVLLIFLMVSRQPRPYFTRNTSNSAFSQRGFIFFDQTGAKAGASASWKSASGKWGGGVEKDTSDKLPSGMCVCTSVFLFWSTLEAKGERERVD